MLSKLMKLGKFKEGLFKEMEGGFRPVQEPETLFVICSDSRLVPNKEPGNLFFIRNVGNIIPPSGVGSSEAAALMFALNKLPSIKDIIICGHSHCGAMEGLLTPSVNELIPELGSWLKHSHSVLEKINGAKDSKDKDFHLKVRKATMLNVLAQMEHLKSYPLIAKKLERNELTIHGWFYDLQRSEILVYEPELDEFLSLEKALDYAVSSRRDKIIEQIAMNYLEPFTYPQTAEEYKQLLQLFLLLERDIKPLWSTIKSALTEELWKELGELYSSKDDPEFNEMLEQGIHFKLTHLKAFQKNLQESEGYRKYMGGVIRHSFFTPSIPKLIPESSGNCFNFTC